VKNPGYMGEWKRPKQPNPRFEAEKPSYYFQNVRFPLSVFFLFGCCKYILNAKVCGDRRVAGDVGDDIRQHLFGGQCQRVQRLLHFFHYLYFIYSICLLFNYPYSIQNNSVGSNSKIREIWGI
jgi:hypothetical protein